ncbi:putative callose synthase 8 [Platanthera guangdongensis]|uniref:Callose synthase 8 n=1 Tax=Platanthera guangdongensis TaxID=2320717 RepID=A0ABR2M539_9ASPA
MVDMQFTYVVSCQQYGAQKPARKQKALEILWLMTAFRQFWEEATKNRHILEVVPGTKSKKKRMLQLTELFVLLEDFKLFLGSNGEKMKYSRSFSF